MKSEDKWRELETIIQSKGTWSQTNKQNMFHITCRSWLQSLRLSMYPDITSGTRKMERNQGEKRIKELQEMEIVGNKRYQREMAEIGGTPTGEGEGV